MKPRSSLRPALVLWASLTLLLGLAYPAMVTAIAQALFPFQANGSIILENGRAAGSELIGMPSNGPGWFEPRPSATPGKPYNGLFSGGSNMGPTNPALKRAVEERAARLKAENPCETGPVPADLATASASGLDPHLTPAAALFQAGRVARERGLPKDEVQKLVFSSIEGRTLGILGEPRVNVSKLNLALSKLSSGRR